MGMILTSKGSGFKTCIAISQRFNLIKRLAISKAPSLPIHQIQVLLNNLQLL